MNYEILPIHVELRTVFSIKMLIERHIEKYLRIVVPISTDTFTHKAGRIPLYLLIDTDI